MGLCMYCGWVSAWVNGKTPYLSSCENVLLEEGEGDLWCDGEGLQGDHEQDDYQEGQDQVLKLPGVLSSRVGSLLLRTRLLAT